MPTSKKSECGMRPSMPSLSAISGMSSAFLALKKTMWRITASLQKIKSNSRWLRECQSVCCPQPAISSHRGPDSNRRAVDHLAQGEGGVDLGDVRHRRQPFLVNAVVILQVAGGNPQNVVILARNQMAGQHVGASLHRPLELRKRLFELPRKRDVHDHGDLVTERGIRQAGVVALDDPGLLQIVEAPGTGRLRQPYLFGQGRVGHAPVLLQRFKYGNIDPVQRHSSHFLSRYRNRLQENTNALPQGASLRKHLRGG